MCLKQTKTKWSVWGYFFENTTLPTIISFAAHMLYLLPHTNYELLDSGLHYRVFCDSAFGPFQEDSMAGDLYLIPDRKQLLYKGMSTGPWGGNWRLVADGENIAHPFEPSHQLIVTANSLIQWSRKRPALTAFKSAIQPMENMMKEIEPYGRKVELLFQVVIEEI